MFAALQPPIRTAVLVDFDNVVSKVGSEFAERPELWLRWIESGAFDPRGRRRRVVIKRVYWNAHNEIYRSGFEAAGFEAFACRSEAKSKKSTADMVLALDAADVLYGDHKVKEFIVLSADTDFVPLLDRLQDNDARVVALVDERDVSSAVYRGRADLVISRHDLIDAAQMSPKAFKVRRGLWGRVTIGPLAVPEKPARKGKKDKALNDEALTLAAEIVARDLKGRGVRRLERERLPRLLVRIENFSIAGAEANRWFGWGEEAAFVEALAEREADLVAVRSRKGAPQVELTELAFAAVRAGQGPGFDLDGAAAEVARLASDPPGAMLNRSRIARLLAGFPTFTAGGARPWMGCGNYRQFIRALADRRDDLKLVSTSDGGVAVMRGFEAAVRAEDAAEAESAARDDASDETARIEPVSEAVPADEETAPEAVVENADAREGDMAAEPTLETAEPVAEDAPASTLAANDAPSADDLENAPRPRKEKRPRRGFFGFGPRAAAAKG